MTKKIIFFTTFIAILLVGCDGQNKTKVSKPALSIKMNVQPLITEVISRTLPGLSVANRDELLNQVCKVAYGQIKPAEFVDETKNIEYVQSLRDKNDIFSQMIQTGDVILYQAVCASYVLNSTKSIPDINKYIKFKKDSKGESQINEVDQTAIINLMPFRLAVARANAELYGKIAANLAEDEPQTRIFYVEKIQKLFVIYAQNYLSTVTQYKREDINHHYQLLLLQRGRFNFKSVTGYLMDVTSEGDNLYYYGVPWLANGYILGAQNIINIKVE
jgi:hypothetical protein